MATFVQIEPDAFNESFNNLAEGRKSGDYLDPYSEMRVGNYNHARRPVRGIQIKNDTYATIQVRQADGTAFPLFDAAGGVTGRGTHNSNFLLQQIQEQRAEKMQVILTFGAPYFYFFGEQPRVISVSGVLLNTEDFNWRSEWWENYELYLRGSQCVRNKTRVYLSWDDIVVEGYISTATASEDSQNSNMVQFQFQMYLTNYQNISRIGDPDAHWIGKEVNLDPSTLDLPGGGGTSLTFINRLENQKAYEQAIQNGEGKNILTAALRAGQSGILSTAFVELKGQVVDLLSLAGNFISGRNIRVPRGFEGAAAFDQEIQISLASVPGANEIIYGGSGNRVVRQRTLANSGLVSNFTATLGARFLPAKTGLPLYSNDDEFVARQVGDATGTEKFNNLHGSQLIEDLQAAEQVRKVYESHGVDLDPSNPIINLFRRGAFGIVSAGIKKVTEAVDTLGSVLPSGGSL